MIEEFRRVIEEAKRLRYPYNHIRILAYIAARILGDPSEIKIVRGLAAAYYTNGYCSTAEADIYAPKLANNLELLKKLGFKQYKEYARSPWVRIGEMELRDALRRMNAYESLKRKSPSTLKGKLSDELIKLLENALK